MNEIVQHLRTVMLRQDGAGLTDGHLLGCFIEQHDEAAVAALVRRHGPMVWGVCRRVLRNHHDAEDAFQATFLVLIRRAASIAPREMVGNWLYGVAHRTALKAKALLAKRRARERHVTALPETAVEQHGLRHDLQPILDQELSRLPDKYRVAIVLCDLEGQTRAEAARQLGVPLGTLAARLTRGRALLAKRLARHGLAVSGGMLAAALAQQATAACRPAALMSSTIKAVSTVAAGQAASMAVISAPVAALTEGVMKTMLLSKLKIATAVVLALTISAAGGLFYKTQAAGQPEDAPRAKRTAEKDLREAAIKAVEQFGKSGQAADREAAIKALDDFRRGLRADEEARRRLPNLTDRFKYRVPVEIGVSEFKEGGHIEILDVWGTQPQIKVGGQYLVHGKYTLPPHERGTLYFYETATGAWGLTPTANMDLQYTTVDKEKGEFTLVHGMAGPGYFHLVLAHPERYSRMFANVYFGTGDNVLRKKSW
jgi:RNA polymerase sigma factor (sigma-70 family)